MKTMANKHTSGKLRWSSMAYLLAIEDSLIPDLMKFITPEIRVMAAYFVANRFDTRRLYLNYQIELIRDLALTVPIRSRVRFWNKLYVSSMEVIPFDLDIVWAKSYCDFVRIIIDAYNRGMFNKTLLTASQLK